MGKLRFGNDLKSPHIIVATQTSTTPTDRNKPPSCSPHVSLALRRASPSSCALLPSVASLAPTSSSMSASTSRSTLRAPPSCGGRSPLRCCALPSACWSQRVLPVVRALEPLGPHASSGGAHRVRLPEHPHQELPVG